MNKEAFKAGYLEKTARGVYDEGGQYERFPFYYRDNYWDTPSDQRIDKAIRYLEEVDKLNQDPKFGKIRLADSDFASVIYEDEPTSGVVSVKDSSQSKLLETLLQQLIKDPQSISNYTSVLKQLKNAGMLSKKYGDNVLPEYYDWEYPQVKKHLWSAPKYTDPSNPNVLWDKYEEIFGKSPKKA